MRIRLGACLTEEPTVCPRCGQDIVERTGAHGLCCATPEATRGHYGVRDSVLALVHIADTSASVEVPELIASAPGLRPADIFTSAALPGGQAALDIGICSPDATGAGSDCVESMWRRKTAVYAMHLEEIRRTGVTYVPLVASCYGRLHPEMSVILERIALQAARRLGVGDYSSMLRRATSALGVAIWRRAVAMARACLPTLPAESLQVLFGGDVDGG